MTDQVPTHHHGDSTLHHHKHEARIEHNHEHSSAHHALHHEAVVALSSPPHHAASDKPAHQPVHTAESVHLKAQDTKPATHIADAKDHAPAKAAAAAKHETLTIADTHPAAAKAVASDGKHLPLAKDATVASLTLDGLHNGKADKAASAKSLDSLVPAHLAVDAAAKSQEKPSVQRTAGAADAGANLFATPADKHTASDAKAVDTKAVTAPAANGFDAHKSLAELTHAGVIVDKTPAKPEASDRPQAAPGEVPAIKVSLQAPADKQEAKPDFVVKKDGTVEMLNNPQVNHPKEIVIQYERSGDQVGLTDAQKAAGGNLFTYLDSQLKGQFPQAKAEDFKVQDAQGLLRDSKLPAEVEKNIASQQQSHDAPQSSGLPERAAPTMQDTRRITDGGRHSSVPRSEINDMTPPVQRIPNEAERVQSLKDTIASYVTRGEQHPYDYAAKRGERGWGIGRYGMTYNQVHDWLSGMTDAQIQELIKEGKLTPDQAKNLEKMRDSMQHADQSGSDNDLDPFLKAMKNGEGTEADIRKGVQQFLPDKVQELAASDQIGKINGQLAKDAIQRGEQPSVNPGQVSLSFVLGHTVNKAEYESNPEYKNFVDSANQAYQMQQSSRDQSGQVIHVENMSQVSDALNHEVGQQFWREAASATEYGNLGCAISATKMLQHLGVQIGTHLDVDGSATDMRHRGWQEVSLAQAERSGQLYVAVLKEGGSHIGLGLGTQVWENSSAKRQVVSRDISGSTLRHAGRAFIVPIQNNTAKPNAA